MQPGLKPGTMPRAKSGDLDTALKLLLMFGDDRKVKARVTELRDITVSYEAARDKAEAAGADAKRREGAAQKAEAAAIVSRQVLADETAAARVKLGERETAVADRENLATEAERSQGLRDKELARRERLLRDAGVTGF